MNDALRSEVLGDIENMLDSNWETKRDMGHRFQQVMTDYEHLELQILQAKRIIEALLDHSHVKIANGDAYFATMSHAKAFLEENDDRTQG